MLLALVTLSLLGDVAPRPSIKRPAPPPSQCVADSDCVLSTFQGCCPGCCTGEPHAIVRGVDEAARCARIDCDMPNCSAVRCAQPPDPASYVAVCRAGRCVAAHKVGIPAECRSDAECKAVTMIPPAGALCHSSPCGCCPATMAVPVDAVAPLQKKPAAPEKPAKKPDFGLSQGGPPPPPAPNCSACQAPTGGTAACQGGRCVLRQVPRPPG